MTSNGTGQTLYGQAMYGGEAVDVTIVTDGTRPADTQNLPDYLWRLLPQFLKRKDRYQSIVGAFCKTFGSVLTNARTTLEAVVPQFHAATATGDYLDIIGAARLVLRRTGEDDDTYRIRVLDACRLGVAIGTPDGLIASLAAAGFTARLWEPWVLSARTWTPPEAPAIGDRYLIPITRPHRLDSGCELDDGHQLDAIDAASGAWADHGGQLTAWDGADWVFVDPPAGFVLRTIDENGRLYRCDGVRGVSDDPEFNTWAHAILQVLADTDTTRNSFMACLDQCCPAHVRFIIVMDPALGTLDSGRGLETHNLDWIAN